MLHNIPWSLDSLTADAVLFDIIYITIKPIYFCYSYPILMTIPPFDWKLNWFSQMGFQSWNFLSKKGILPKNCIFSKKRNTLSMFWFSWKLVSRLIRLCWFQKSNRFSSTAQHSRVENFGSAFCSDYVSEKTFFDNNFRIECPFVKAWSISSRMVVLSSKSVNCSKSR